MAPDRHMQATRAPTASEAEAHEFVALPVPDEMRPGRSADDVSHPRVHPFARPCYRVPMRTTVEFDPDTAKAVERLRRDRGLGVSDAVNELIRRGMLRRERVPAFRQRTHPLGITIDVANVADALEELDGAQAR